ncbi:hypothetical protein T4D_13824 [Trichinella pseudospiralis]|uniref:Uncharacterized protein n=1 Tax=Trichinella pseudospiralis TaxID=6337 RepID=A0A0V1DJY3_TRIPS|nr:hypothetical protein T4D_13824 [Trichinella pseudospiralis]
MSIPCTFETSRKISIPQINYMDGLGQALGLTIFKNSKISEISEK